MARRILAIVNPISGRRSAKPDVDRVAHYVREMGGEFHIEYTAAKGHAIELAANAPSDIDALLIGGGDGTVGEVLNGLNGRLLPVAILSTGTENLLAHEFRMPRSPRDLAAILTSGETRHVDVGVANGRRFLAVVGVGFDAEVVRRLSQLRKGNISHASYFWPLWETFWMHRWPNLRIESDGNVVFEGRGMAFVGQIARYALGLRLLANAVPDDGLLDLCVMPCCSKPKLLSLAVDVLARRHTKRSDLIYRQVRQVHISSDDRPPIEIDGDAAGDVPVDIHIEHHGAVLLQPRTITRLGRVS